MHVDQSSYATSAAAACPTESESSKTWSREDTPQANGDPLPPYDPSPTVNVIITGECQQGKSTLIRHISRYAHKEDTSIGIGDGNNSCTTEVDTYDVMAKLRRFCLVDGTGQLVNTSDHSGLADLLDLEPEDARVVEVDDPSARTVRFRFVDTPGLNGTHGEDFSIMSRILSRATSLGRVNALIYVRSVDNNFGSSFQTFFRYIERAMPNLCNGLIAVHSCCTADRVAEYLKEGSHLEDIRQDAFHAATGLDLHHVFMDNSPDRSSPFAVVQSLNGIHRLLSHLASQKPLPVHSLRLLKTEAMRHRDVYAINALAELGRCQEKEWFNEKSKLDRVRAEAAATHRQAVNLKAQIASREVQIAALRTQDEFVLGKRSWTGRYGFINDLIFKARLSLGTKRLKYIAEFPISSVAKTCSPGTKWQNEDLDGKVWSCDISGNLFRDVNGTATFYTTSEHKYSKEIERIQFEVGTLHDLLAKQGFGPVGEASTTEIRLRELGGRVERTDALLKSIGRDELEMSWWPSVRGFYMAKATPTAEDVKRFIAMYDEMVAQHL